MYLLDTNIISEIARNPSGPAGQRFALQERSALCTSVVVSAEVRFGLRSGKVAERTSAAMVAILDYIRVAALERDVAESYAEIRTVLKNAGRPISANDYFIAAHALALDATLVTDDAAFARVPGLKVENWLRQEAAPLE